MQLTAILLQSLDGFLATDQNDDLSWGTSADKSFYKEKTKEIGTVIMGSTTYQKMPSGAFRDRYTLVMTSEPAKYQNDGKAERIDFFSGSPAEAIAFLEQKGIQKAAIVGGGKINAAFLEAGLISEIYITVAPYLFMQGVKVFAGQASLKQQLELKEVKQLTENEVLLHYLVLNRA